MIALLAAFVVMSAAAEPATGPAAPAAAPEAKKTQGDPNAVVCHKEEVLGTRMSKRICETKEQADSRRKEDQDNLQHIQNSVVGPAK